MVELLEPRQLLAANPLITEFMADNDETLLDGNGNASDWIEIHNAGDAAVDLNGWYLTDDPGNLAKWSFPSADLLAGDYLVVFASAAETPDPGGNLHTSFKLSADGEYVALVRPDGRTIAAEFGPHGADYPRQREDLSYGIAQDSTSIPLLAAGSIASVRVPTDGRLGTAWTQPAFLADASWTTGPLGIGFDATTGGGAAVLTGEALIRTDVQEQMYDQNASALMRVPFELAAATTIDSLTLRMKYDAGFVAYLNGIEVVRRNAGGVPGEALPFDAAATRERSLEELQDFEAIDLTPFIGQLNPGGTNVLAIHGLNAAVDDPDFFILPEFVAARLGAWGARYFTAPSPGQPNVAGFLGLVEDTAFSQDRGFYDAPFHVEITSATPAAEIYYTTDGSEPWPVNPTAKRYSEPIPIATTTTLRAAAVRAHYLPTDVDTETYIFLDQVIMQDPLNDPAAPAYPAVWQARATADFAMDPEVVAQWDDHNPANEDFGIRAALTSIPTMSIVMDHDDLWDATSGIYPDATKRGAGWRRPGSIEYFDPETGAQFQVNAGVQMHGNASRDNVRLKKHSFRLVFSNESNGPGALPYPLFADSPVDQINTLVMRACFTDAFATRTQTNRYSPLDSQYTRDVWVRDTQLAMGHLSAHGTFVHLYINGLYWGLYNPAERPDDAFLSAHLGGTRDAWDIIKDFNELEHGSKTTWNAMFALAEELTLSTDPDAIYQQMQGNDPDGTPNPSLPNYLDMDNLIDFMILHLYAGAEDWPHHNWYAARNRVEPGRGFQFFVWDQEMVLDGCYRDRTNVGTSTNHRFTPVTD